MSSAVPPRFVSAAPIRSYRQPLVGKAEQQFYGSDSGHCSFILDERAMQFISSSSVTARIELVPAGATRGRNIHGTVICDFQMKESL